MSNCQCHLIHETVQRILKESERDLQVAMAVSPMDLVTLKMNILSRIHKAMEIHCTCFIGQNLRTIATMLTGYFAMEGREGMTSDIYAKETDKVFDKLLRILYNIRA